MNAFIYVYSNASNDVLISRLIYWYKENISKCTLVENILSICKPWLLFTKCYFLQISNGTLIVWVLCILKTSPLQMFPRTFKIQSKIYEMKNGGITACDCLEIERRPCTLKQTPCVRPMLLWDINIHTAAPKGLCDDWLFSLCLDWFIAGCFHTLNISNYKNGIYLCAHDYGGIPRQKQH